MYILLRLSRINPLLLIDRATHGTRDIAQMRQGGAWNVIAQRRVGRVGVGRGEVGRGRLAPNCDNAFVALVAGGEKHVQRTWDWMGVRVLAVTAVAAGTCVIWKYGCVTSRSLPPPTPTLSPVCPCVNLTPCRPLRSFAPPLVCIFLFSLVSSASLSLTSSLCPSPSLYTCTHCPPPLLPSLCF